MQVREWTIPLAQKLENEADLYCGPLSDAISRGKPTLANIERNTATVFSEVTANKGNASGTLENC